MKNLVALGYTIDQIKDAVIEEAILVTKRKPEKHKPFSQVQQVVKYGDKTEKAIVILKRKSGKNNWEVVQIYDMSKKKRNLSMAAAQAS